MAETRDWATGNGWYPAKPSGHSEEISGNPPVLTRFFISEINNFASCLGVAAVAEVEKKKVTGCVKWLCYLGENHDLSGFNSRATHKRPVTGLVFFF